jgi:uncharacterized protein (TIGR02147 family)
MHCWALSFGAKGAYSLDMRPPIVYEYNDFRRFLADWYTARNQEERSLTKSEMSRRLGLPNTRSYFTDVLGGREVTDLFLERFVAVLGLDPEQARFFRTLVRLNQAKEPDEREQAFDQLVALNRTPVEVLDPRAYRYYRHWWNGALRALFAVEDHADDWSAMAARLVPAITAKQARDAVSLMAELGMVERDAGGFWKPTQGSLSTGDRSREQMVLQNQMQKFELARRAVMTDYGKPKEIATSTLHVSRSALDRIRRRTDRYRSEVRSIAHKDEFAPTEVWELALALFPLVQVKP